MRSSIEAKGFSSLEFLLSLFILVLLFSGLSEAVGKVRERGVQTEKRAMKNISARTGLNLLAFDLRRARLDPLNGETGFFAREKQDGIEFSFTLTLSDNGDIGLVRYQLIKKEDKTLLQRGLLSTDLSRPFDQEKEYTIAEFTDAVAIRFFRSNAPRKTWGWNSKENVAFSRLRALPEWVEVQFPGQKLKRTFPLMTPCLNQKAKRK